MRWLISDVPKRVELAVEPLAGEAAGAVNFQVRARDEKFQPLDDATVTLEIQPVLSDLANGTNATNARDALHLRAEPSSAEAGLYEASYVPRTNGGYGVTARVVNTMGAEVGQAEAGWSTDLLAEEFRLLNRTPRCSKPSPSGPAAK